MKKIVNELRDENETYRLIVMETVEKIINLQGVADVDSKLESQLIEGMLFAY